jgi:hypothetical protein
MTAACRKSPNTATPGACEHWRPKWPSRGLSANELARALISMMARSPIQPKVGYIDARPFTERWSRFAGQFGGLAKVDSGFDYAANFSSFACLA